MLSETFDKLSFKPIIYFGISLGNCGLEGSAFLELVKLIEENKILKSIDLDFRNNKIGNSGIKGLFTLINTCRCLQNITLNLRNNSIDC